MACKDVSNHCNMAELGAFVVRQDAAAFQEFSSRAR